MIRSNIVLPSGPSKLSQILAQLNAPPKLTLNQLKGLRLSYAFRNDHFGARHFVKDQLPRIRFANPALDIHVERVPKLLQEPRRPLMKVEFENGAVHTIDMHEKRSTTILKELMDLAGGHSGIQARPSGQPVTPEEGNEGHPKMKPSSILPVPKAHQVVQNGSPSINM